MTRINLFIAHSYIFIAIISHFYASIHYFAINFVLFNRRCSILWYRIDK